MIDHHGGITAQVAAQRLREDGPNELPRTQSRSLLRIITDVLREPMFALLLAGGGVYLALGDFQEAVVLVIFATFSVSIAVGQDLRSERALEALRSLASPRALVVRDGKRMRIPGREVVRGDIILVAEGDRVAADAVVRETTDLRADESALSGESVPVPKTATSAAIGVVPPPGGDDTPVIFAGTLIVGGQGVAEVLATGRRSQIGTLGASLGGIATEQPRLKQEVRGLIRIWAVIGAVASLGVVLIYGLLHGGWLNALLAGIATGMSMLPEEFPLVLTVFMVMGAWRMSQKNVLTRRAPAIELLGSANLLCADKTGTLTQNSMRIARLRCGISAIDVEPSTSSLPFPFTDLVREGTLACPQATQDPMELAFHALCAAVAPLANDLGRPMRSYPLRPGLMAFSQVWPRQASGTSHVAAKGAVEAIILLCRLKEASAAAIRDAADGMAREGLRVLGVAKAELPPDRAPPEDHTAIAFTFVGLVGLSDPLRPEVLGAVAECRRAGIRIVMITGDYPATASAIAAQSGIKPTPVLSGADIAAMNDAALANALTNTDVYARIAPLQKLRIVKAFQANGDVVAMTGDGVNDAPSLKAAHIGIAMGNRGTDVAREAASLVLLTDNFTAIVEAIRLGRRIYDNLRKAMSYIMAIHVPIAGLALLPLMLGLPALFFPIHIAFLEMIIDPICSIAFEAEPEERDIMDRPPRPHHQRLFSRAMVLNALMQGFIVLALVLGLYAIALQTGKPIDTARTMAFVALVAANASLILINRSFLSSTRAALIRGNKVLLVVAVLVTGALTLVLTWEPARALFRLAPMEPGNLAIAMTVGVATFLVLDIAKRLRAAP
ncbi:MAG: cation-translocating P-type ATPase [Rhodospirillaceae bacterium]|nr:cation-translocating P-type ATPase [Rhodospirillaceae bacterium]